MTQQDDVQQIRRVLTALTSDEPAGPELAGAVRTRIRRRARRRAATAALLLVTGLVTAAVLVPDGAQTRSLQIATTTAPPGPYTPAPPGPYTPAPPGPYTPAPPGPYTPAPTASLDEEKRVLLEQQDSIRHGDPASKRSAAELGRPPEESLGPWDRGIIEDREVPPTSSSVFVASNRWQGAVDGREVAVYAGRSGQHASQGMVLIFRHAPSSGALLDTDSVHAPDTGALRVHSAQGSLLTITAVTTGEEFLLDLRDEQPGLRLAG